MHSEESIRPPNEGELMQLIETCPLLTFTRTRDRDLLSLLNQENKPTSEMAELIRPNRAMTNRLLRTVNSAYYGLAEPVEDIEEAILYMGLTQLRRIVLASPMLEDPKDFGNVPAKQVRMVWRNALATAVLTQELIRHGFIRFDEETSYLAGLMHDIGHLVMEAVSPDRFQILKTKQYATIADLLEAEEGLFGWNHTRIGAHYLRRTSVPSAAIEAVRHHHDPENSTTQPVLAAAVSLAEELARRAGLDGFPKVTRISEQAWNDSPAWSTIFGNNDKLARVTAMHLRQLLHALPDLLQGFS